MRIAIGSDHAGFELKERVREFLAEWHRNTLDKGTHSTPPAGEGCAEIFRCWWSGARRALRVHLGADASAGLKTVAIAGDQALQ